MFCAVTQGYQCTQTIQEDTTSYATLAYIYTYIF